MKVKKADVVRVKHILKAIELVEKFTSDINYEEFYNSDLVQSAVIRQLEIIGEASANVSNELKLCSENIAWREIKGFRNVIIHEYFRIDIALIWSTIENELPILKEQIQLLVENIKDE